MLREAEFAKRMISCREKLNLKQNACAQLVGVSRQHYNNWEIGICKPKGERIKQLAAVLQCDATWLQHGEGSELELRLLQAMRLMRVAVREIDHVQKALHRTKTVSLKKIRVNEGNA